MNEKKILKMDDEAMQNVTGGQEDNMPGWSLPDDTSLDFPFPQRPEDPNIVHLTCYECGGDLGITNDRGSGSIQISTINGTCPHCGKPYTIMFTATYIPMNPIP